MMDWIERYIYEVTRRLPEKDREEVSRELYSNICDMLPENASEEEIKAVLNGFGPPAALSEQYRQKPRYLISPAMYDYYIRTLKWAIPLVGCILFVIGAIIGVTDAIQNETVNAAALLSGVISNGLSIGISAAFQALVWVTIGFVIADRTGAKIKPFHGEWTVDQLNDVIVDDKKRIPLSDSITELVMTAVFTVLFILFCMGTLPFIFIIRDGSTTVTRLFSESFLNALIPCLVIGALFGIFECIAKIIKRRHTLLVCVSVILSNLANIALSAYLLTRPVILSTEFTTYIKTQKWGNMDILRFMGNPVAWPLPMILLAIIVICSLINCITAIVRTVRTS